MDGRASVHNIWVSIRSFLLVFLNREFLIFLFFLLLSGTFWLLLTLNESYENDVKVTFKLVNIPKNIVLTSDTTTDIEVTVRDKGYSLFTYKYANKIQPVKIDFKTYARQNGVGTVSSAELKRLIYTQLYSSSRIINVKPDKFEFLFNQGLCKRVPVRLTGKIVPGQSYYFSKVKLVPDSIDIYANKGMLDSIKCVYTQPVRLVNITDTVVKEVMLKKTKGVKYIPERVKLNVMTDILTEESFEVPIVAINMPEGKKLRTFPSKVKVKFYVGVSMFRFINAESFKVVADYNELVAAPSDKCNIYLRSVPTGVRNARLEIKQVDSLIAEP